MSGQMVLRRTLRTLLLVSGVVVATVAYPRVALAQADQPDGPPDYSVDDEITVPGDDDPGPVPVGDGPSAPPPECVWQRASEQALLAITHLIAAPPMPSPDAYPEIYVCNGRWVGGAANLRWVMPGTSVAAIPTPAELAQVIYVRLEGSLPAPEVASDPAPTEAAIVSVPTFVAVSNWTDRVIDQECDPTGVLCVSVTATPALSFSPGEPGAPTMACSGGGSRFVEGAGDSAVQAAVPGACSYAYRLRTGTAARPSAWPGMVATTWDLAWQSTSGASGTLPEIVRTTSVPRQVHEVQTVIER